MAKITKQSLAEFAKAMAALDTADQEWILSREEMQSFSAGRDEMAAYFGDNQRDQANHVLAGLGNDLLTTEVGEGDNTTSPLIASTMQEENPNMPPMHIGIFSSESPSSGAWDDCSGGYCDPSGGYGYGTSTGSTDTSNALRHPLLALEFKKNADRASEMTKDLPGQRNGYGDAIRHCLWSAMNQMDAGKDSKVAKEFGDGHENVPNNPEREKKMDLHNNSVGYELGKQALKNGWSEKRLLEEVEKAACNGRLIWY